MPERVGGGASSEPSDWSGGPQADMQAALRRVERIRELEAENGQLRAEAAKWEGRARQGVTTPPPGYDGLYVTQHQLRLACEQRDEAEASSAAAVEELRNERELTARLRHELELQLQAEHERQVSVRVVEQQPGTEGAEGLYQHSINDESELPPESPEHQPDDEATVEALRAELADSAHREVAAKHRINDLEAALEKEQARTVAAVVELLREARLDESLDNTRRAYYGLAADFIESHPRFKAAPAPTKPEMTNWERRQVEGWSDGTGVSGPVDIEAAVMAAEHAARAALLEHGVDLTALVLNVTFDTPDGGKFAVGSQVPSPPPEFLAASLYQSATEAGLTASDML